MFVYYKYGSYSTITLHFAIYFFFSLVDAELCAASALVAMGTIHGNANPVQLLMFALIEVTGFVLNQWIIQTMFQVR